MVSDEIGFMDKLEQVAAILDKQDISHFGIIQVLASADALAKKYGIVIARGYSDDLCLFGGAWDAEAYVHPSDLAGNTLFATAKNLAITSKGLLINECGNNLCPYHKEIYKKARKIAILGNFLDGKPDNVPVWSLNIGEDMLYVKAMLYDEGKPFTEVLLFYAGDV